MSAGNIKTVSAYVAGQQTQNMMQQNKKLEFGPQVKGLDVGNMAPLCPDYMSDQSYQSYIDGLGQGPSISFGFGPPKAQATSPELQEKADAGRAAAQRSVPA